MSHKDLNYFGNRFERSLAGWLAVFSGLMLAWLAIRGPLCQNFISYKTHPLVVNQLLGQDAVNLFLISPLLVVAGILLLRRKRTGKYLLLMTPLFLMYYAISYMMGWEWMAKEYYGNSEKYFFHFLFILISAVVFLLYGIHVFPKQVKARFTKKGLGIYSFLFCVFLSAFAYMWMKEIFLVMQTGTARGYDIAPGAFWLVRTIDLGFCIPLGFISIYLLWTRPEQAYTLQYLFYGFFLTQVIAVLAMAGVMYVKSDPTFDAASSLIFVILSLIIVGGFVFINRNYRLKAR